MGKILQGEKMNKKLTNSEYREAKGVSASDLKYMAISPLHYEAYKEGLFSQEDNQALIFGDAFHSLVLEPERFEKEYAVENFEGCNLNKNSKAYKEARTNWLESVGDRKILSANDYETLCRMKAVVDKIASPLFQGGEPELSFFIEDRHGIIRKCRPDYFNEDLGIVVDLKTTSAKTEEEFQKSIWNFKYHWQEYWYREVLRLLGKDIKKFVFVAVSKAQPHLCWVVELEPEWLEIAEKEVEEVVNSYVRYLQSGIADVVKKIDLPYWIKK
jgi:hypothetical protein